MTLDLSVTVERQLAVQLMVLLENRVPEEATANRVSTSSSWAKTTISLLCVNFFMQCVYLLKYSDNLNIILSHSDDSFISAIAILFMYKKTCYLHSRRDMYKYV